MAEVIAALTREEKVGLVMGVGMGGDPLPPELAAPQVGEVPDPVPGAAGRTYPVPRLGIPSLVFADGPAGLRIAPQRPGEPTARYYATAFPIASSLASTWNPELVQRVGQAMGAEARGYGVDVLLGPALNVQRVALGGRNYEYYSEDPLLSGKLAAALVRGVQSQGVGASLKHFVANNHEWNRTVIDVRVDPRALREIYLRGFEIAVRESAPWTVMSSYNRVNGTFASESPDLLTDILREQWHFDGVVMTDWFAGRDPAAQMRSGNDLLMPGTERQRQALLDALEAGQLEESVLDRNVERVLRLVERAPTFRQPAGESKAPVDLAPGARVARAAAAEGMVLLKNQKAALPLPAGARVALFGSGAYETITGGTGSGDVNEAYTVSFAEGLEAAGYTLDSAVAEHFREHLARENAKLPPRVGLQAFFPAQLVGEPELPAELAAAASSDVAVVVLRRSSGEFADRAPDDFVLAGAEKALLQRVSEAFHRAGKRVVGVLNVGGSLELTSLRDRVDALLLAWQPGQEAGHALADVLSGKVTPSGKLAMTMPVRWTDAPAAAGFPGEVLEPGDGSNPLAGARAARVEYADGLFVGYRHFGRKPEAVVYPFGHGLSYTRFEYGPVEVEVPPQAGARVAAALAVDVKNAGERPGAEVVQLYVTGPQGAPEESPRALGSFGKTRVLAPGERQVLRFELDARAFAHFDGQANGWVAPAGAYTLEVGASSSDVRQRARVTFREPLAVSSLAGSPP